MLECIHNNVLVTIHDESQHESMTGLGVTAHWELIFPDPTPVPELQNYQVELSGKATESVRGTVKVAVLQNDSKFSNLVAASCCVQKPFFMISHSIEEITWVTKTKQIYTHAQKNTIPYHFL